MAEINISRSAIVLVDDDDLPLLIKWRWTYLPSSTGRTAYAVRWITVEGKRHTVYMHRQILGAPSGVEVDHKNGNGLDNRRLNLRIATSSQNSANVHVSPVRQYFGVYPAKAHKWRVQVKLQGRIIHLGTYEMAEEAARVRDAFMREHFGEFAQLNFPG